MTNKIKNFIRSALYLTILIVPSICIVWGCYELTIANNRSMESVMLFAITVNCTGIAYLMIFAYFIAPLIDIITGGTTK